MPKKLNKYADLSNPSISADIDRLFPNQKNLVLEEGNFVWSKVQLEVAIAKGIKINNPCQQKYGLEQGQLVKL
tara:strand:+ start:451 stop:669 length:219 start_codon:yes stop_codon:yes gene_type:complete